MVLFNALATPISVSLTGKWDTSTHLLQVVLDYDTGSTSDLTLFDFRYRRVSQHVVSVESPFASSRYKLLVYIFIYCDDSLTSVGVTMRTKTTNLMFLTGAETEDKVGPPVH